MTRQNELVERTLSKFTGRDALGRRLGELMEIGSISLPSVKKTRTGTLRLFYTRREPSRTIRCCTCATGSTAKSGR